MSAQVVVVGSCMVDFVSYAPRLPQKGETIHGTKFFTNFGGKGANQCVAAARLGANAILVARVGDDLWGDKYIENLKSEQIETKYIEKTPEVSSGVAQINVSDCGHNQIVIVAGANSLLNAQDVEKAKNDISNAAVVVLQLETPVEVALKALQLTKGISILNGAPALSSFDPQLLSLPTIFCVNETEAEVFSGFPVTSIKEAEAAAKNLISKGCNSVILTLGAEGAIYLNKDREFFHVSSPSVECADSTGAGDAFIGALAFFLANKPELSMKKVLECACFIAADSVTRAGTQQSFPGSSILKKCPL